MVNLQPDGKRMRHTDRGSESDGKTKTHRKKSLRNFSVIVAGCEESPS